MTEDFGGWYGRSGPDWSALDGPVVSKHATDGVSDVVSLVLAPALAACGAYAPIYTGPWLGHLGGALEQLAAIPGYERRPDMNRFRRVVGDVGCAIAALPEDVALNATLSSGLDVLALDIKCGSGASTMTLEAAIDLAESLMRQAGDAGCKSSALITDMNEPLASAVGSALEVWNACACLTGDEVDPRLWDLTLALGGEALTLAGLTPDAREGARRIADALQCGAAADRFGRMIAALGGPKDFMERFGEHLPEAPVVRDVPPRKDGIVQQVDVRAIGLAALELAAGDPSAGFDQLAGVGAYVDQGFPLARVHTATEDAADRAAAALSTAYRVGDKAPEENDLILHRIGGG